MSQSSVLETNGLGATERKDFWWVGPLLTALGLGIFGVYTTYRVFENEYHEFGSYLSPFYSPNLKRMFGWNLPFPYTFAILWVPAGFRATCYYYRKAYYRSFFADPPGCAVGEPKGRNYKGETSFPFILQNIHRYFFYLAGIVLAFLWYDAYEGFFFQNAATGKMEFGVGVGTIVLLFNCITLTGFSFGCNSLRHLIGGKLDCFSCTASARMRYKLWGGVTILNLKHQEWAWVSLFAVGFADLYVRMCSLGIWHDIRFF